MKARFVRHALFAALAVAGTVVALPANADRGINVRGGFSAPGGRIHGPGPAPRYWDHGHYNSRWNGWWIVGTPWLFYPPPVYSYPQPVIVQPEPAVQAAPQPTAQNWYYCDSAQAYYPYAQSCPEGWRSVPAAPPGNTQNTPETGQSWYYCDSARGYYPYVQSCPESWRPVTPTPPAGTPDNAGARQP